MTLTAPRLLTFAASLILAALAVANLLHVHLPAIGPFVADHRTGLLVAAYAVLAAGVVLPRL